MKTYEGLFIFDSEADDEALKGIVERVSGEITKLKGSILKTEILGRRPLARPIKKRDTGLYARLYFALAPENVTALHARYKLTGDVIRLQLTCSDEAKARAAAEPAAEPAPAEGD